MSKPEGLRKGKMGGESLVNHDVIICVSVICTTILAIACVICSFCGLR